jgi:glutathione S-transferase
MEKLTLYIGNKNYSSWSLRPWIALTAAGIAFEDVLIPFDFSAGNPKFKPISPTGKVPVLHQGDIRVWESLAIIEYAAELFPDEGRLAGSCRRSRRRALRLDGDDLRLPGAAQCLPDEHAPAEGPIALADGVMDDVARIETIWRELGRNRRAVPVRRIFRSGRNVCACRQSFRRLRARGERPETLAYMTAMKSHPAMAQVAGGRACRNLDRTRRTRLKSHISQKIRAGTGQSPVGHV